MQSWLRISLQFIVAALLAGALAEGYIRWTRPHIDLWELTGRTNARNPMADWASIDAFAAYVPRPGRYPTIGKTVNSHGFISTPELALEKPANTIRIVFLGESSTAGTGHNLADHETWPWRSAEILRTKYKNKNIEFINGAAGGYTSFESYGRLWSRIRFFRPDYVVLYHGWNELYYTQSALPVTRWRTLPDGSWGFHAKDVVIQLYQPITLDHWIRWSQLLTRIRLRFAHTLEGEIGRAAKTETSGAHFNAPRLDVFRTHLRLFKASSQILGAQLLVAKQATLIVPNLPVANRAGIRYDFHGLDHDGYVQAFAALNRVIDEEIQPQNIIDARPLSGVPENFADHIHPTVLGADRIAQVMASNLLTHIEHDHPSAR